MFSVWFYYFLLNFNKLYPKSVTNVSKIVKITYAINQELFKRRLCKENVWRNVNSAPGVKSEINPLISHPLFVIKVT